MSEISTTTARLSSEPALDWVSAVPAGFPRVVEPTPRLLPRLINLTPFAIGGLLLVAAGLKAHQLLKGELPGTDLFSSRWFRVLLIDAETLCGLALILRFVPALMRRVCQLLFAAFLGYSVYQIAFGAKACACLGFVDLGPAAMMSLDFAILGALWLWRPPRTLLVRLRVNFLLLLVFALPLAVGSAWLGAEERSPLTIVSPTLVDLGTLPQGLRQEFTIVLRNEHKKPIVISHIKVSCPCVSCLELPLVLTPGQETLCAFDLDLSAEPNFTGDLFLQIQGVTPGGQLTFMTNVSISVSPISDS